MIHFTEEPTLKDYVAACRRRAWVFTAVLAASLVAGFQFIYFATPLYEAKATVLVDTSTWNTRDYVERAEVPEVARVVEMLATRVLAPASLTRIASGESLYPEIANDPAKVLSTLRKNVSTEVTGFDQFQVRFVHPDPQKAAVIANALGAQFVDELKRLRELHGTQTTDVMTAEITAMSTKLAKQNEQIKKYRIASQGSLPGQTEGNVRIIERWQGDLRLNTAALERAKQRLALALASTPSIYRGEPIEELRAEIAGLETERAQTTALIRTVESKVNKAAEVEGTLAAMTREYNSTLASYDDMIERRQAASLRAQLDKSRFDSLFRVVEAAKIPAVPFQPAIWLVMSAALAFGLLGGAAVAIAIDWFDDSFHDAAALTRVTGLPVLALLPRQRNLLGPPARP